MTARAMRALRADDHFCQLGPDELVVVCAGLDDAAATEIVARLEHAMSAPFQVGATEVALGVDIGVASAELGLDRDRSPRRRVDRRQRGVPIRPTCGTASGRPSPALPNDIRVVPRRCPTVRPRCRCGIARRNATWSSRTRTTWCCTSSRTGRSRGPAPAIKTVLGIDPATLVGPERLRHDPPRRPRTHARRAR